VLEGLHSVFRRFADSKDSIAVIDALSGRSYTYDQLFERSHALGLHLYEKGVSEGMTVSVSLPNSIEFITCYFACILMGYSIAPISPDYSLDDRSKLIQQVKSKVHIDDSNILEFISGQLPKKSWDYSLNSRALFFTSGTTTNPKVVQHNICSMLENVLAFNELEGLDQESRMLHVLPMSYMAGFLNTILGPFMAGGVIVVAPRFSPASAGSFWSYCIDYKSTVTWITPSIATTLIRLNRGDFTSSLDDLNQVFCGTAPLPSLTRENFKKIFGKQLQESYGTSELLLISAQTRDSVNSGNNVGHLLNGITACILPDEDGTGELAVNSPYAYSGYLGSTGTIEPGPMSGNFHLTGDIGEFSGDFLSITGRKKDLIIRGGVNISPASIENTLSRVSGVSSIAAVGIEHDFWGEDIVVFFECLSSNLEANVRALLVAESKSKLLKVQQPTQFVCVETMPRTDSGKIRKDSLRRML
jgi:acyl-CoA synthetase (AMP-forming)/AMP-acid ligase II